uniref:Methyltransferase type 12 domain-containing protein n=1 Tax=Chromera velia CCMP2878 TaxID=1169474 RepID=A0A0G4HSP1_9ALVE|eukprot:Cvel_31089.t1-p1 / transcript=Cvel_31089.t1 / gene=Cvel_31089 / organism=Chromera_velia_CCMP2878 / gene_product=hypothetical protein / transcript_product=hypothetical protein / location=Cvel_scaffold4564:523-2297(+) / protein_length=445 / sequence_SO=supercontig / SO=protein_coding / is_pseudo=false
MSFVLLQDSPVAAESLSPSPLHAANYSPLQSAGDACRGSDDHARIRPALQFDKGIAEGLQVKDLEEMSTGQIPTGNGCGVQMSTLCPLFSEWILSGDALMDIGAAYGLNSFSALKLKIKMQQERLRQRQLCATGCEPPTTPMHDVSVTAVDFSSHMIQYMERRAMEGLTPEERGGFRVLRGKLPFMNPDDQLPPNSASSSSFDAILVSEVFHFLSGEEIEESLRQIHRLLKPNGKVFITTWTGLDVNVDRIKLARDAELKLNRGASLVGRGSSSSEEEKTMTHKKLEGKGGEEKNAAQTPHAAPHCLPLPVSPPEGEAKTSPKQEEREEEQDDDFYFFMNEELRNRRAAFERGELEWPGELSLEETKKLRETFRTLFASIWPHRAVPEESIDFHRVHFIRPEELIRCASRVGGLEVVSACVSTHAGYPSFIRGTRHNARVVLVKR